MNTPLRVLLVEDSADDAALIVRTSNVRIRLQFERLRSGCMDKTIDRQRGLR